MNKRNLLLFVLTILVYSAFAAVFTYPSPNEKYQSGVYKVEVIQKGDSYNSFVYEDLNPDDHKFITDYNHWTGFSFSDKVMVKVIVQSNGRKIKSCWVHPYPKNIIPKVNKDTISFEISEAGQYFVRILFEGDKLGTPGERQGSFGYENPLFIFADPPETYIPDTNDNNTLVIPKGLTTDKIRALINSNEEKSTIYFKEGAEHRLGEKFVAKSNTTYYIPGGAYVIGNFIGDNLNNIKIIGRGIISLVNYPRHGSSKSMDWNLIYFTGDGANQYIEGITFTNPSHFCVLSRGEMHLNWCKMFGWYVQTDGFGGGDGSKVENTFMKVMDDNVKLYSSNNVIRNLVIYKQ
ncbi:MAG: hypothetical protein MI922_27905, partial [Bacteroidales bacterium]|nr:hypothetical protein [Bacteroidales bacterium]